MSMRSFGRGGRCKRLDVTRCSKYQFISSQRKLQDKAQTEVFSFSREGEGATVWVCRARHACRVVAVGVLHPVTPCRITVHVCKRVDGVQTIHLGKLDKNADTSNAKSFAHD